MLDKGGGGQGGEKKEEEDGGREGERDGERDSQLIINIFGMSKWAWKFNKYVLMITKGMIFHVFVYPIPNNHSDCLKNDRLLFAGCVVVVCKSREGQSLWKVSLQPCTASAWGVSLVLEMGDGAEKREVTCLSACGISHKFILPMKDSSILPLFIQHILIVWKMFDEWMNFLDVLSLFRPFCNTVCLVPS